MIVYYCKHCQKNVRANKNYDEINDEETLLCPNCKKELDENDFNVDDGCDDE